MAALNRSGIRMLAGTFAGPFIQTAVFFGFAGRLDLPGGWIYLFAALIAMFAGIVIVARVNPELVNIRGNWKNQPGTKTWDRRLIPLFGLTGFYLVPLVAGLDVGRYRWSVLPLWLAAPGVVLLLAGSTLTHWAMIVNRHFEVTVRLQTDLGHTVVMTGPYAVIRHPGYLGVSFWILPAPLIFGSAAAFIPSVVSVAVLILRAALEDRTLQKELPGYPEYACRTRYRLIPGIW